MRRLGGSSTPTRSGRGSGARQRPVPHRRHVTSGTGPGTAAGEDRAACFEVPFWSVRGQSTASWQGPACRAGRFLLGPPRDDRSSTRSTRSSASSRSNTSIAAATCTAHCHRGMESSSARCVAGSRLLDTPRMSETLSRWSRATSQPDMWIDPDDDPREEQSSGLDERSILIDYLRRYRLTMQMKCADLDAAQMARRSVPPSTMSLLGLVRHMAEVERNWFRRVMAGEAAPPLYYTKESPDEDWDGARADEALVIQAWQARPATRCRSRSRYRRPDRGSAGHLVTAPPATATSSTARNTSGIAGTRTCCANASTAGRPVAAPTGAVVPCAHRRHRQDSREQGPVRRHRCRSLDAFRRNEAPDGFWAENSLPRTREFTVAGHDWLPDAGRCDAGRRRGQPGPQTSTAARKTPRRLRRSWPRSSSSRPR